MSFNLDGQWAVFRLRDMSHRVDTTERLIGPGLLGIGNPEHDPVEYIRTSILHPSEFLVPDYPDNLMPKTYGEIYTEDEINDLVAYLMTLQ